VLPRNLGPRVRFVVLLVNTRSRGTFRKTATRTAIAALAWLLLGSHVSLAEPSASVPSAEEVRAQRFFRGDEPLWRRALGLPADVLLLTAWPLQQTLFWMERIDLPDRIEDGVTYPVRRLRGEDRSQ